MAEKSNMSEEMDLLEDTINPDEEVIKVPKKDDDVVEDDIDETPSEEDDEEEEKPDEDEDEEEDEEDLSARPTFKQIKEKYPDVFKDFPDLKTAFFKSNQYEQVFPTIEDAKEAYSENESYINLRESVLSGNPEFLLTGLKTTDQKAYNVFVRKIVPTLWKNDKELYTDVATPIVESLLRNTYRDAVKHNNEELINAVKAIGKSVFNDEEFLDGKVTFTKPIEEPKDEEVKANETKSYNTAQSSVSEDINKGLRAEIRRGLDPNNAMTPFIRKSIIDATIREISNQLSKDLKFQGAQSGRWSKAKRTGYDDSSKRQLINAALARAKQLVPEVRNKMRSAAFGKVKDEAEGKRERIKERTPSRRENNSGRVPNNNRQTPIDSKKINWSKTSDADLFDDKVTYRN
jgi:hypothetical protein